MVVNRRHNIGVSIVLWSTKNRTQMLQYGADIDPVGTFPLRISNQERERFLYYA